LTPTSAWNLASLAAARARIGDVDGAEQILADLERRSSSEWISPMTLAAVYAALGRFEDAVAGVERAFEERDCWMVSLAVEPAWAILRGHPRFEAVVAKVGIMERHPADLVLPSEARLAMPTQA
jgi:hypothetical protein